MRLEDALDLQLRDICATEVSAQASLQLGAYRREGVEWIVGTYLTLRPSFERTDAVYAYLTDIAWDEKEGHLVFKERERLDAAFAQKGQVSMPYQSGQVYLVTNEYGQFRLAIVSRPSIAGTMYGLLSTLYSRRGGRLTPVSAPIVFLRQDSPENSALGLITDEQAAFATYQQEIDRIRNEEFGVFL